MSITWRCPKCSHRLAVNDERAGKTDKCPQCGAEIVIPKTTPPEGIGGWLTIPAIGLVLAPIAGAVQLWGTVNEVDLLRRIGELEISNAPDLAGGSTVWLWAVLGIVRIIGFVVVACLFYARRRIAVPAIIWLLYASILIAVVQSRLIEADIQVIAGTCVIAGIWVPYFLRSKRVKNTFVR